MTESDLIGDPTTPYEPPERPEKKLSARRIALGIYRELRGIHAAIIAGNSTLEDILEELREERKVDVEQRVDQGPSDFDRELIDEQTRPTPKG